MKHALIGLALVASLAALGIGIVPKEDVSLSALSGPDLASPYFCFGGNCVYRTSGTCASGTSTPFAMVNPWSATSTASIVMTITGQATSTDIEVGTTTRQTGLTAALVSNRLIDDIMVATSTQTAVASGVDAGGYQSAGTLSAPLIVVKSGEYVGAYSTSTYGDVGALNYTPGLTCNYSIEWRRMF
jgi:hypothetical protein